MKTLKINSFPVPADKAFWYRMALLDVQQVLIDGLGADCINPEAFQTVFDAVKVRYDELWLSSQSEKHQHEAGMIVNT